MTHRHLKMGAALWIAAGVLACSADTTGPNFPGGVAQYFSLTFNHHAITLATVAPYDTLTLVATPRTGAGDVVTTTDTIVYTSNDTSVLVTPDGKIHANTNAELTSYVQVVATLTIGGARGVTLADTAYVNVVAPSSPGSLPAVGRFSLEPVDSAAMSGTTGYFPVTIEDDSPEPQAISWAQVYYHAPSNTILTYDRFYGYVSATGVGRVMLYADAVIFGQLFRDSLQVTVGHQTQAFLDISIDSTGAHPKPRGFPPDTMFLGVGGVVIWHNVLYGLANDSIDVQFTGPATPQSIVDPIYMSVFDLTVNDYYRDLYINPDAGGDIAPFVSLGPTVLSDDDGVSVKARRFTVPGTYTYHSLFFPGNGIIVVVPNSEIR